MRATLSRPRHQQGRTRGQSLVEFALVLPVMLVLVLFGIDFGRVFLGWVQLNNVVREAANFAAENPTAWNTVNPNTSVQAEYRTLVQNEATSINCTLPSPIPDPTFSGGSDATQTIGTPVYVRIPCTFTFITPVIGGLFGGSLPVAASASYPSRSGMIPNIPLASVTPSPSATATPTPTPSPTATATSTATPTPTPMCSVPNFNPVKAENAAALWASAGFTTQLVFNPLAPAQWPNSGGNIIDQSIAANLDRACDSTGITITWK
jgi:hypothetical protein